MNQRGFALGIAAYAAIGAAVVILGLGVALKVQSARLHAVQVEFDVFVDKTAALGLEAEKAAERQKASDKRNKERADAENRKLRTANDALAVSLRESRADRGYLPRASAGAGDTDRICFSRAELDRTIRELDGGVSQIISQCDAARIGLDTARDWIKAR